MGKCDLQRICTKICKLCKICEQKRDMQNMHSHFADDAGTVCTTGTGMIQVLPDPVQVYRIPDATSSATFGLEGHRSDRTVGAAAGGFRRDSPGRTRSPSQAPPAGR